MRYVKKRDCERLLFFLSLSEHADTTVLVLILLCLLHK